MKLAAHLLWAGTLVVVLLTLYQFRSGRSNYRAREKRERLSQEEDARGRLMIALDEIEQCSELKEFWQFLARKTKVEDCTVEQLVRASTLVPAATLDKLRESIKRGLNHVNDVAADLDLGILSSMGLVVQSAELHKRSIEILTLCEPFIWYESLVGGRGRWSYRALAVLDIALNLRRRSAAPNVSELKVVPLAGVNVARSLRPLRTVEHLRSYLSPPTINVRSKVKQNRLAEKMLEALVAAGVEMPSPEGGITW